MPGSPDAFTPEQLSELPVKNGFRLRGMEMTRTETFTDAAFAFAVTLLVISIDAVPTNYDELINALRGVPAFAASFALLIVFWTGHWSWSRRFGLEDGPSILLSTSIVFMVLVYVYPLKYINALFVYWISGGKLSTDADLAGTTALRVDQLHNIFAIYGMGFVMMTLLIILLNVHALRRGDALGLDDVERATTRSEIVSWCLLGATGLASVLLAWLAPRTMFVWPGWVYCILPIIMPLHGVRSGKRIKKMLKARGS